MLYLKVVYNNTDFVLKAEELNPLIIGGNFYPYLNLDVCCTTDESMSGVMLTRYTEEDGEVHLTVICSEYI